MIVSTIYGQVYEVSIVQGDRNAEYALFWPLFEAKVGDRRSIETDLSPHQSPAEPIVQGVLAPISSREDQTE